MKFQFQCPDSFRAQYFLELLREKFEVVKIKFAPHFPSLNLETFLSQLAQELDQVLIPTIAYEIHMAKLNSLLDGSTPRERYSSFFVNYNEYTEQAKTVCSKYYYLIKIINAITGYAFSSLDRTLERLMKDKEELQQKFSLKNGSLLVVESVANSDRHGGSQVLLLHFSSGTKILYKETDLSPDLLLRKFIDKLSLPNLYDLKTIDVLPKKNYGWIGYVEHESCLKKEEVQEYYIKFGSLLAITNILNYNDGHSENLIANGKFPVLLDGETLFQNYECLDENKKDIFSTMLIQKDQEVIFSALQSIPGLSFSSHFPFMIKQISWKSDTGGMWKTMIKISPILKTLIFHQLNT